MALPMWPCGVPVGRGTAQARQQIDHDAEPEALVPRPASERKNGASRRAVEPGRVVRRLTLQVQDPAVWYWLSAISLDSDLPFCHGARRHVEDDRLGDCRRCGRHADGQRIRRQPRLRASPGRCRDSGPVSVDAKESDRPHRRCFFDVATEPPDVIRTSHRNRADAARSRFFDTQFDGPAGDDLTEPPVSVEHG